MPRHVMSYGISEGADVRATDVRQEGGSMCFTLHLPDSAPLPVRLNLPGKHNVLNALAAAAIGWQLGVDPKSIAGALEGWASAVASTSRAARVRSRKVLLVDDYGHHRASSKRIRQTRGGRQAALVVAFQPHRYSRTRSVR
jgi:UDP-N-acetylmuramate--alanine ligase